MRYNFKKSKQQLWRTLHSNSKKSNLKKSFYKCNAGLNYLVEYRNNLFSVFSNTYNNTSYRKLCLNSVLNLNLKADINAFDTTSEISSIFNIDGNNIETYKLT